MDQAVNQNPVRELLRRREQGREKGIYACCSANEYVIRAAIRRARDRDTVVLVEATANQVNQPPCSAGASPGPPSSASRSAISEAGSGAR